MKYLLKWKWPVLIVWIALAAVLFSFMPDTGRLVREKGEAGVPEAYLSEQANQLLQELNGRTGQDKDMSVTVVFHDEKKLNQEQMLEIEQGIRELESRKDALGITDILSHVNNEDAKDRLLSKDGTAVLTVVTLERGDRTQEEVRNEVTDVLKDVNVPHELTGAELILEDFIKTTQSGIKKTEGVAVLFIVAVLIIIFRSPVAPVVSLLSVALTYLTSLGIVTRLVDRFDFPFSNFTQIFLVLVLFGIGTDYNILLFTRFKEELTKRETTLDAIVHTYKTAGKTVLYSGLAVFIGFSALGLAEFKVFKSASAVGIGVGILLAALFTVVPVFMGLLGGKLFWPAKAGASHKENKATTAITGFAVKRPVLGLLLTLVIAIPGVAFYNGQLSYNSLKEIAGSYPSVKGINIVYDHFPPGQALPTTLVLKADEPLDSQAHLAFIDEVTDAIGSIDGVAQVYSATRPKGEKIPEFYTNDQSAKMSEGLGKANDGIVQISDGLAGAVDQLNAVPTDSFDKVDELIAGTKQVQVGIDQAAAALGKIDTGLMQGADAAGQLQTGVHSLNGNLSELTKATSSITGSLQAIVAGYDTIYSQYEAIEGLLHAVADASGAMNGYIASLEKSDETLKTNRDFQALKQTSQALSGQVNQLSEGFAKLNRQFQSTNEKLAQIGQGVGQIGVGQKKISEGAGQIEANIGKLRSGLTQSSEGQRKVIGSMPQLSAGLTSINEGQAELNRGLDSLDTNMAELKNGLSDSVGGLNEISGGLKDTTGYLDELTKTGSSKTLYIPDEVRTGEDFAKSLDTYMSEDRQETKWVVILADDPYSTEAMDTVEFIHQKYEAIAGDGGFTDAPFGIAGTASQNADLNAMSTGDFAKTAVIMLAGILIVLFAISRSFWIPIGIIASLVLAYYTSLTATELIFRSFTSHPELTWTIPFFAFIMIVALGVDYSIFLITRYREFAELNARQAISEAMKHTGSVIVSAVIILSGTFAAMYPSGVLTLIQLATTVIVALFLLAFLFLPLFLPAFIALVYRER